MQNNSQVTVIVLQKLPGLIDSSDLTILIRQQDIAHGGGGITRDKNPRILDFHLAPTI